MLAVGLTGGIGAGKSFCSRIFEILGVPVYISDVAAKLLMTKDPKVKEQIIEAFGEESYSDDGVLNRSYLSHLIFNDQRLLQKINSIVHPAVRIDFMHWGAKHLEKPYIIQESALVYEGGLDRFFNKVILVFAPDELRIQRVIDRDNVSREEVLKRMSKQLPQEEKVSKADYIIYNDGSKSVISQVSSIHKELLMMSNEEE